MEERESEDGGGRKDGTSIEGTELRTKRERRRGKMGAR